MSESAGALVLDVQRLHVVFDADGQDVVAVDDVSFSVPRGRIVGLVGESGSGKSATAAAIGGVLPDNGDVRGGTISFDGSDLLALPESTRRRIRGDRIGLLFQEPGRALNPVLTVGAHFVETIRAHRSLGRREARARGLAWLERVRMPAAAERLDAYAHELSGGMAQRVALALAMCLEPDLLVADEPTTALDVTVQSQVLALFRDVVASAERSMLLITHDLGVVAEVADDVLVMVSGRIVEEAPAPLLFSRPLHPYTRALLDARPPPPGEVAGGRRRLGVLPSGGGTGAGPTQGCVFVARCPWAEPRCAEARPELTSHGEGHRVACLRAGEVS